MDIVSQVCDAIMRTLTTVAELAGRESRLVQRARKLTGDKFAAIMLATGLAGLVQLEVVVAQIRRSLASGCRMNRRKGQPNTYQLLLALDSDP